MKLIKKQVQVVTTEITEGTEKQTTVPSQYPPSYILPVTPKAKNIPVPAVPAHPPNTMVIRPRGEKGITFEYVEKPAGHKQYLEWKKKKFYVMYANPACDKSVNPSGLEAYIPPTDRTYLPTKLRRAVYGWESWGREFGYHQEDGDRLKEAIGLAAIMAVIVLVIIILYL